jgi:imidazolonepropionase-like amidohydrolase
VITMHGDEVIERGTVVVEGNRIVAVGSMDDVEVPVAAHVVDASGKVLAPGLVDVHWHGAFGSEEITPQQNWVTYASLAFGVTTAHDPSNDTSEVFAAAELQRTGAIVAPRIFSTGTIVYGAEAGVMAPIDSLDDARQHLSRLRASGAFSVKSYNQPRRDQRQQVIEAARELGMLVVPEGGSTFQHNLTMIVDGHTGIEHSIPVAAIYSDVEQLWGASGTGYTPTLGVGYGGIWGESYWYQHTEVWKNERLLTFVPRRFVEPRARRRSMAPEGDYNHFNNAAVAAQLQDKGVLVNLGAHGQREGLAAHWELWMFAQGGMTPLEALRAGTLDGAKYLGLDREIGSLEVGKLADLMVLGADPLEDIRNSEQVEMVMVNGRLFDASSMEELGNHPAPGPEFFFSTEPALGLTCSGPACEGPAYARCSH